MARSSALRASVLAVVTVICATLMTAATAQRGCGCSAAGVATYRMNFTSTWTNPMPPSSFPHWARPVGTSHGACYSMWRRGTLASAGIKRMAELGESRILTTEFNNNRPNTLSGFTAGILGVSGSTTATFTADRYHSLVSFTIKVAPSPDWFAGYEDSSLCISSTWISTAVYALALWDAGTDSGLTWSAINSATRPAEPIAILTPTSDRSESMAFLPGTNVYKLGTVVMKLIGVDMAGAVTNPNCAKCPAVPAPNTTPQQQHSTTTPQPTTMAATAAEESSNVAYGPIVGGVVGGVACLVLVVLAVIITLYLLRREKQPVKRNAEKLISSKELDMECK